MYDLPQAGLLAELLKQRLSKHWFYQNTTTPGFWIQKTRPIQFSLDADDFGMKYVGREHVKHLKAVLEQYF